MAYIGLLSDTHTFFDEKLQEFFKDVNSMQPEKLFDKWAPVTLTVRLNKLLRNILAKLGLYYIAKNLVLKLKK